PIHDNDTGCQLRERLASLGAQQLVAALEALADGRARPVAQPAEGVTYAHKLQREEACIDWQRPATELARCIRAFNNANPCWTTLGEHRIKLWFAHAETGQGAPGQVLGADNRGIRVACGEGVLCLDTLQMPG